MQTDRTQYDYEDRMGLEQVSFMLCRIQCQRVRKVLEEYVEIYKEYSDRADREDFKLFVNGVAQKIGNCMEEAYAIKLEWL